MKNVQKTLLLTAGIFILLLVQSCQKEVSFSSNVLGVKIGTQLWTLKNLDVVTYRTGDVVPQVTDKDQWANLTTGAWCYYNNDANNNSFHGKLYNWYAVNDSRGLAPEGWHIPSKDEWTTLVTFLGGDVAAGGKMKATTLWISPNTGATNESGFTALPGGYRKDYGDFGFIGTNGYWWFSKEHDTGTAVERSLSFEYTDCNMYYYDKRNGMSVRCVKNSN